MILLLSDDLLDASKTIGAARAAGIAVLQLKTVAALLAQAGRQPPACVVLDLQAPGLDVAAVLAALGQGGPRPRAVAYGSHVDADRLKAARDAGCDEVYPRSKYFQLLPAAVAAWGGAG
jgi:DNA-binding NarL/FixJ family response regulator